MFDQDDGPPPLLEEDEELSFFSSQDPIVTFQPSPTRHPSQDPIVTFQPSPTRHPSQEPIVTFQPSPTRHPSQEPGPVPIEGQNRTLQYTIWNYEPIAYTNSQEASDPMVESDDEDDVENYRAMWNDIGQLLNYVES